MAVLLYDLSRGIAFWLKIFRIDGALSYPKKVRIFYNFLAITLVEHLDHGRARTGGTIEVYQISAKTLFLNEGAP